MKRIVKESLFEKFEEKSDPVKDMGIGFDPAKDSARYEGRLKSYKPTWVKTKGPGNRKNTQDTYDAGPGPKLTAKDIIEQINKEIQEDGYSSIKNDLEKRLKVLNGENEYNLHGVYVYNKPLSLLSVGYGHTPMSTLNTEWDPLSNTTSITPGHPDENYVIVHIYQQVFLTKKEIEYVLNKINSL